VAATPEPESDALLYQWLASALAGVGDAGQGLRYAVDGMAIRGWTQPAIMGALYAAIGHPEAAAFAWIQAVVILPATTALVYFAGRFAFGRSVGLVAALAFALWFPLVYYTTWLMPETTVGLVVGGVLSLLALLITRGGLVTALALGAALALLSLTHSAWQFVGIPTVAALALHFLVYDRSRLRLAGYAALVLVAVLGSYSAVRAATDLPRAGEGGRGYGAGGGWGFWVGSRSSTDFLPVADDYTIANHNAPGGVVQLAQRIRAGELTTDEHLTKIIFEKVSRSDAAKEQLEDGDFYDAGIRNLLDDPGAWPEKVGHGLKTVFLPAPDLTFYAAPLAATWFRHPWRQLAGWVAALMIAGLALVTLQRRDRLVLFVPLVFQVTLFVAWAPESRYGYPLLSSVFLLASFAVVNAFWMARNALAKRSNYSQAS
jgi:hypothetical protein